MIHPATPPQTIGPFFHIGLDVPGTERLVAVRHPGAVRIQGRVLDGAGEPVIDALIEVWDAQGGRFGRCATDAEGRYHFLTVKPPAPSAGGAPDEAPHLNVSVFARGLLDHLVTRIYFPDEAAANATDPVLSMIADPRARATLIARAEAGSLRFDIHLQGEEETVFFAI
ncbi:MAG TPA: protocatechuate 3,4-dioxygenase subunit alpha [Candidatus Methylomirabilis sp.]|nr:protocatechuate 3,4-dioxygenase subunit alpha [Candidatus Methylomirabilis sp.]